jgi:hypothetical protein
MSPVLLSHLNTPTLIPTGVQSHLEQPHAVRLYCNFLIPNLRFFLIPVPPLLSLLQCQTDFITVEAKRKLYRAFLLSRNGRHKANVVVVVRYVN